MSWAAVAAAVIGAVGSGIAGAQAGQGQAGPRKTVRDTAQGGVQALARTVPNQLMYNQLYDPQYTALGSSNLDQLLFGSEAGTYEVPKFSTRGEFLGMQTATRPQSRGLIDIIGQAAPAFRKITSEGRAADMESNLANIESNLPKAQELYAKSNPELKALRDALTQSARTQLAAGSKILPEDAYRITSNVRGDWANRGLGASAPAQLDESLQLFGGGERLRASRVNEANSIMSTLAASEPDFAKFLMSLGDETALANAFNLVGGNESMAFAKDFDPLNSVTGSLGATGARLGAEWSGNQADMFAGLSGGLLGLAGQLWPSGGGAGASTGGGTGGARPGGLTFSDRGWT